MELRPSVRILIADDHALLRDGIRALLHNASAGSTETYDVVAEAADGRQAVQLTLRHAPDLVLLDVEMPGYSAVEALRQIRRLPLVRPPRVLLLGTHTAEVQLFNLITAGAAGLVLKESTGAELLTALRNVSATGFYLSPGVSSRTLKSAQRGRRPSQPTEALSERERQVLQQIAIGLPNRQIAERLSISVKTVEAHKAHIISRLGLRGSGDLVRYAAQMAHMGDTSPVNGGFGRELITAASNARLPLTT